jgi:hypothetical protein
MVIKTIAFAIFSLICIEQFVAEPLCCNADSILHYTDGNDSVRFTFKEGRIYETINYFPDGKMSSKMTDCQRKYYKRSKTSQVKFEYVEWNNDGKIMKKVKGDFRRRNTGSKQTTWTYIENGKKCRKKEVKPWGTKN